MSAAPLVAFAMERWQERIADFYRRFYAYDIDLWAPGWAKVVVRVAVGAWTLTDTSPGQIEAVFEKADADHLEHDNPYRPGVPYPDVPAPAADLALEMAVALDPVRITEAVCRLLAWKEVDSLPELLRHAGMIQARLERERTERTAAADSEKATRALAGPALKLSPAAIVPADPYIEVPCPRCNALAGETCREDGRPLTENEQRRRGFTHDRRVEVARVAMKENDDAQG